MVLHIWSENWRQLVNISVLVGQFSYKSILFSMYNLFMWINHVCYLETTIQSLFFFFFKPFQSINKIWPLTQAMSALALSLFLICFGCECQLNAWKVKIQKLCSRHVHLGPNKQMSRSSQKNKAFFSLLFAQFLLCSLHIKILWPLFSSILHLFTCLVIVQSHCFYHLPTSLTDHFD